ncbi:Oxygen-dependent choline dehydrogenase [Paramyrothecium foliicola]|nr:Oxygen-dependent choline dehydrogenase [Paramyrothecium foliicola]
MRGCTQTVKTRRLVILSAGTLGSPSILERSGICHLEVLKKAGTKAMAALWDVNDNYQDQQLITYFQRATPHPNEIVDGTIAGRINLIALIANNKRRPTVADVAALGPK